MMNELAVGMYYAGVVLLVVIIAGLIDNHS